MNTGNGKPTRNDVARRAGVAAGTVYRVLTGQSNVSEAAREKVLKAVEELQYKPNLVASSLRAKRSRQIGVIVPNLRNPYFAELAEGIQITAAEAGYDVLLTTVSRGPEHAVSSLTNRQVDAIITSDDYIPDDVLTGIIESGPRLVFAGFALEGLCGAASVVPAFDKAAALGVDHLVSLGHVRIALVSADSYRGTNPKAVFWEENLARHGLRPVTVVKGDYTYECGYGLADEMVGLGATAILLANDFMAMGLLDGLAEMGARVPEDVSVMGIDDVWMSNHTKPGLTTIRLFPHAIGAKACRAALDMIEGNTACESFTDVELVPRLSTGPATKRMGGS